MLSVTLSLVPRRELLLCLPEVCEAGLDERPLWLWLRLWLAELLLCLPEELEMDLDERPLWLWLAELLLSLPERREAV